MTDSNENAGSRTKMVFVTLGIFVAFGFLVLILSGAAGRESFEDRAYRGEFSEETIEERWQNLEDSNSSQEELFDIVKVDAAMKAEVSDHPKAAKTGVIVPGSPTFLKQSEATAEKASEGDQADLVKPQKLDLEDNVSAEKQRKSGKERKLEEKQKEAKRVTTEKALAVPGVLDSSKTGALPAPVESVKPKPTPDSGKGGQNRIETPGSRGPNPKPEVSPPTKAAASTSGE